MGYGHLKTAARRDSVEPSIVSALQDVGAVVWRLGAPCDLAVAFRGRWYMLEVKSPKGRLTKAQIADRARAYAVGCKIPVITSPMEALEAIGAVIQ